MGGVVMGSGPAAAVVPPQAGDACTVADLGQRWPVIDTASIEPVITHFRSFFVIAGSTGEQQVRMEVQNVIEVMVNNERSIKVGFNMQSLVNVEAFARQFVQKTTRSTNIEAETIIWRFNEPGHYGVYKGTRTVTGRYSGINCHRVAKPDGTAQFEWVARPGGPYTTFSHEEMGAVRCVDEVPVNSLMRKAQEQLGCFSTPAPRSTRPAPDSQPTSGGTVAAGPPPGFTCDPVRYRLGLANGLYWYFPGTGVELRPYTRPSRASASPCAVDPAPATSSSTC